MRSFPETDIDPNVLFELVQLKMAAAQLRTYHMAQFSPVRPGS